MTRNVDQLRSIQTFEELIPFLEDDLDWPFPHGSQDYEFDDLTFEYTPDELGLEDEYAAKIKRIHQLRPLVSGQPWGIFFVEFENKKLPIVVLRRILSHLVLKQRKSANPADRARWNAGDLLFISAFAEEGTLEREIAFAHFHQDPGDQPTLRVLGWDGGDTPLKLEHVSQILKHRLSWPRNPTDHVAWRKQWAGAFRHSIGQQIRTADLLAQELARVARNIRDAAMALMKVESSRGPLRRMHEAFRIALIHDLTQEGFADTYAQTITYGLLTAAISRTDRSAGADGTFVLAEDVHNMVPITNPFLKEMLESFLKVGGRGTSKQPGLDFDELGVQEVVEMLRSSEIDLPAVLDDFGNRNPGEDPVIRFYEDFLKAYDKELKIKRGVFYTPQPVVSYIVRSVHELLQTEFGLADGLASTITWGEMAVQMGTVGKPFTIPEGTSPNSHFVVILDPATGTATFLVEVIDLVFKTMTKKWRAERLTPLQQREEWNRYVPTALLPRLYGYELMMAPYAIAHMKLGLKLHETGFDFSSEERVRVYLTSALEPGTTVASQLTLADWIPALAKEAEAVARVKELQRFTVFLGNPPYASISSNMAEWIREETNTYLLIEGTKIEEKSKRNHLQNDYIKFFRIADICAALSPIAICGYITSNSYLDGRTLRGLRWNLLQTYQQISILNLFGDSKKRNASSGDENVFDITEGVAVVFALRDTRRVASTVLYGELQGSRADKYKVLLGNTIQGTSLNIVPAVRPHFLFTNADDALRQEFMSLGPSMDRIYGVSGAGVKSNRDEFATSYDQNALITRMGEFADRTISDDTIRKDYGLKDNYAWKLPKAREDFRSRPISDDKIANITYRPFDTRFIYYDKAIVFNPRFQIMNHMLPGKNTAIVSIGQNESMVWNHAFVSRSLVEIKMATHYGASVVFPQRLYPSTTLWGKSADASTSNLTTEAKVLKRVLRSEKISESEDDVAIGNYVYAILYSNSYRTRYAGPLMMEFPRVPERPKSGLLKVLIDFGARLMSLHLLEAKSLSTPRANFSGSHDPIVEKISYRENVVYLDKQLSNAFHGISEAVWEFRIGGYQVCEKWLKDRKGEALSIGEINIYCKIVTSISETIELMRNIDAAIEEHGGWPGAFA